MRRIKKRPDKWVIAPPKDQDIKYCTDRKEYSLEYIYSEDAGLTVEIMRMISRNPRPLYRRVYELRSKAKQRRKDGQVVDNWFGICP